MRPHRICIAVALCLVAFAFSSPRCEISVHGDTPPVSTLISAGIVDDPDPVGPVGPVEPNTLDAAGGRPDVAITPGTGAPLVVWASTAGADHDVAFARWLGSGWSPIEYVTSDPAEELDPRIFRGPDGTLHVVWWRSGDATVWLSSRSPGTGWGAAVAVSDSFEVARRPSVAVYQGELWVAYERDSAQPGMAQDVVVAHGPPGAGFTRQVVASTASSGRLDVLLHVKQGVLWIDWMHSDEEFGCLEFENPGWSAPAIEPWYDHSWVGVEQLRKVLERHVLESR